MTFALPIALTLAVLALPIIAFYILKLRLRRVPVSTNLFWKQIYDEKPPRSIWQQFRHLVSLLLQLLMLLLLVVSIADPYLSGQLLLARRIVLVIDHSASMRARDIAPTRLEAAKRAAVDVVNGLRLRDEMAIVQTGAAPEVLVGMTGHIPTLHEAISRIEHSDAPTRLRSAVELGRQLIGDHPRGEVLVLTDGCVEASELPGDTVPSESASDSELVETAQNLRTGSSDSAVAGTDLENSATAENSTRDPLPVSGQASSPAAGPQKQIPVVYRLFAADAGNVGITQFQARRSLTDPLGYEVLMSVRNASSGEISGRLELTLNGLPVDILPLTLKPDELWSRSLEKTSLEGGILKAELTQLSSGAETSGTAGENAAAVPKSNSDEAVDALITDNIAWALLPERVRQRVLIVTPGNLFLQKVFEANPLVEVSVQKDLPQNSETGDSGILVIHGKVPSVLPAGNVFVIDPSGSCDQWQQGDTLDNPIITDQDQNSPLMNHIRLDNVVMPEAKQLQFTSEVHALAKTLSGDVVYASLRRPNGRCLVLSINLDRSDLAFRTAFPILVANSLGWFSGASGEMQTSMTTGSVRSLAVATNHPYLRSVSPANAGRSRQPVESSTNPNSLAPQLRDVSGAGRVTTVKVQLASPSSQTSEVLLQTAVETETTSTTVGPLNECGIWKLMPPETSDANLAGHASLAEVAVNLASDRETDLRPLDQLKSSAVTETTRSGWFSRPLWFYLILLACVLTSVEWFLYQRRWIT